MPPSAAVDALLATGGWSLSDAQARRAAAPDTFHLPPPEALAALHVGSSVRLLVDLVDLADDIRDGRPPYAADGTPHHVVSTERMWFWVTEVDHATGRLVGVLQNMPFATHSRLMPGATVEAAFTDVIAVEADPPAAMADELGFMADVGFPVLDAAAVRLPEDPLRPPSIDERQLAVCAEHDVLPHRPWPMALCLLGRTVTPEASGPLYGVRARPRPDRQDCGWAIWTGTQDMGVAAEADGFDVVEVGLLHRRAPAVWRLLALPPGFGFVIDPAEGYEDVFTDAGLLE